MKKKFKSFLRKKEVIDSLGRHHIVSVYGELRENEMREGFSVAKVTTNKDGKILMKDPEKVTFFDFEDGVYGAKKSFNMGYSICDLEHDVYDKATAIKLAKRRFSKSPLTTRRGTFLTLDMVNAIIDNEINYISNNIDKYVKCNKTNNGIPTLKNGDYIAIKEIAGNVTLYAKYAKTINDDYIQVYWYGYKTDNEKYYSEGTNLKINVDFKNIRLASIEEISKLNLF